MGGVARLVGRDEVGEAAVDAAVVEGAFAKEEEVAEAAAKAAYIVADGGDVLFATVVLVVDVLDGDHSDAKAVVVAAVGGKTLCLCT